MARFPFRLWVVRKSKTPEGIISEGVENAKQLDEFLKERGVSMPEDISEFEKIWNASKKEIASQNATTKKANTVSSKNKPARKTTTRSTRKKSNIKDTTAES